MSDHFHRFTCLSFELANNASKGVEPSWTSLTSAPEKQIRDITATPELRGVSIPSFSIKGLRPTPKHNNQLVSPQVLNIPLNPSKRTRKKQNFQLQKLTKKVEKSFVEKSLASSKSLTTS